MIKEQTTIGSPAGPLTAYVARPSNETPRPAVIVLEGVYGFDDELKRITDLIAAANYVGVLIDYLRGQRGEAAFSSANLLKDVETTRDWLNDRPYVAHGRIGAWGFGLGGSAAFVAATLPGIRSAISFYGQSIVKPLPGETDAPIRQADAIRAPLLLVFGGADEQVSADDIRRTRARLDAAGKRYDVEVYPNVGHSFFRQDRDTVATREIADAWDRVQAFLGRTI